MKKTLSIFIVLLLVASSVFAQEKQEAIPVVSPKNAINFNLGGYGFIYSLGYERQTRQIGLFNIYGKISAYSVPFAPMLFDTKQMGASAEIGFKLGRSNKKFVFGLGVTSAYYYWRDFNFSFPVTDGSFRYTSMFGFVSNITYQHYFKNSKWRFESGGTILLPFKQKYDIPEANYCGPIMQFEENYPIPWLTMGLAYTF